MLKPLFTLGSILFLIILTYAYQMRQRKFKKYPTACDVLYYPEQEKKNIIDREWYKKSSPYKIDNSKIFSPMSEYPNETILDQIKNIQ